MTEYTELSKKEKEEVDNFIYEYMVAMEVYGRFYNISLKDNGNMELIDPLNEEYLGQTIYLCSYCGKEIDDGDELLDHVLEHLKGGETNHEL